MPMKTPSIGTMTTFFNPTEAPTVHIEQLPSNAIAVEACAGDYTGRTTTAYALYIGVWAPRSTPMSCKAGGGDEEFVDSTCYDCQYYVEEIEVDLTYHELEVEDADLGTLYLHGTAYASSPCSCYNHGLGEVEFPCHAGHEGPGETDSDIELSCEYMQYGIVRGMSGIKITDWAQQQGIQFNKNGTGYATQAFRAINTFDNNPRNICWGDNDDGNSLLEIEMLYTTSFANEDLLSFDSHIDNTDDVDTEMGYDEEELTALPYAVQLSEYNHRPKGLAVAAARGHMNSYFLMTASGARTSTSCAYVPVELYRNVAVDNDTVLDVWVSDVMPTGCRLMYLMYPNPDEGSIFLGQIPADFNLQPCKSIKQQSSDAGELVNS